MIDRLNLFWRCAKCGIDQLGPVGDIPVAGILRVMRWRKLIFTTSD